jgi:4-amino-4-deoxy-L-arabinose transferase-like glycosyltransferase
MFLLLPSFRERRKIMRSIIWLIVGLIFISVGVFVYFIIGTAFAAMPAIFGELQILLQYGIGGVLAAIGAIMALSGLIGVMRGAKRSRLDNYIAQTGAETEAIVTFIIKNYSLLVNNRPLYSIVGYTYQDELGNEHANRIENFSTDYVIRNKVEVGSKIRIKYLPAEPGQSVITV